jgi:predicted glycosyltransferase
MSRLARATSPRVVWIDIENPPQVQYLTPFAEAFARLGYEVRVTARDHGMALELLRLNDVTFSAVGRQPGANRLRKVAGTFARARSLRKHILRHGGAELVLCGSRSGALAARMMGIPAFSIVDYEHVELRSYRLFGANMLFPSVIGEDAFRSKGFVSGNLVPFAGLKEDFSFAGKDLTVHEPQELSAIGRELYRVLVRPPAEDSHYFKTSSRTLVEDTIGLLAQRRDVQVVLAPRRPEQRSLVDAEEWVNQPIVLKRAIPFIDLLGSVDCVVCSGGTMLREAAYLGVPAVAIFAGPTGGVDAHLASIGAARLVRSSQELGCIDWKMRRHAGVVAHNPGLVDDVARQMSVRASG